MKVLTALSAATIAAALPIHANVRVVSLGENGEKSVQTFNNVDLGDSMESATNALNQLVKPHAPTPVEMISESEKKLSEVVEKEKEVEKVVDSQFQDLKEQGMENMEVLKQQAMEFVEQAKEFLGDAADRVHQVIDSHGEKVEEPLKAPKNFKGKHHSGKKHGAKANKHHEFKDSFNADGLKLDQEQKVHHKNHKNFKVTKAQVQAHGVKPHAKMPCAKKLKAMKQAKADGSYHESVKQWSQGLYNDVSSIDFNHSIGAIRENDDAMCAIAGGFFGGVALITIMTVVAHLFKGKKSIKLEDEEASLNEKN